MISCRNYSTTCFVISDQFRRRDSFGSFEAVLGDFCSVRAGTVRCSVFTVHCSLFTSRETQGGVRTFVATPLWPSSARFAKSPKPPPVRSFDGFEPILGDFWFTVRCSVFTVHCSLFTSRETQGGVRTFVATPFVAVKRPFCEITQTAAGPQLRWVRADFG